MARTIELGGQVCIPPFEAAGVGRIISVISEPTGANCYVIQLKH